MCSSQSEDGPKTDKLELYNPKRNTSIQLLVDALMAEEPGWLLPPRSGLVFKPPLL